MFAARALPRAVSHVALDAVPEVFVAELGPQFVEDERAARVSDASWLELGLARVAFMSKNWADAESKYAAVLEKYPRSKSAPEALYWKGVSHYKATNDHTVLGELPGQFREKYPDSNWALKTIAWEH